MKLSIEAERKLKVLKPSVMQKLVLTGFWGICFGYNASCQKPVADFEFSVEYKCGYATTAYVNTSTNADTFLWDVGHGYFKEIFVPRGSNTTTNKKWVVTLIAKGNGLSDTISKEVEVFNTKIKFDKTVSDSGLYAPLHVDFFNQSQVREDEDVSFSWDFGDGSFSEAGDPEHLYDTPGTYDVILYGNKSDGCELMYHDHVIVKDTAQHGEFSYIVSSCRNYSCPWDEPHILQNSNFILNRVFSRNDSLILSGMTGQNCCTIKTATLRQHGDTIVIKTWEYGPRCWCVDDFYFEIALPSTARDSVILSFNDVVVKTVITGISSIKKEREVTIHPNPVNETLWVRLPFDQGGRYEYSITNMQGGLLQNGILESSSPIKLSFAEKGLFVIRLKSKKGQYDQAFKFMKE